MKRTAQQVMVPCVVFAVICLLGVVPGAMAQESAADVSADGVVAFYFHGNVRCATCKKIEAYADEAVHSGFPEALDEGALTWRVVNVDDEGNQHFIQDFQLVTRSVVLAEFRGGKVVRWQNLDKVWQLVRDKERFVDYIQDETIEFLGTS
jgi:hypothetical protein